MLWLELKDDSPSRIRDTFFREPVSCRFRELLINSEKEMTSNVFREKCREILKPMVFNNSKPIARFSLWS